jgi:ribosomal protein L14
LYVTLIRPIFIYQTKIKKKMKKYLIAAMLLTPSVLFSQNDSTSNIIQEGTIIKAALTRNISGKELNVGQTIDFELADNIILNDKVVLPKGAKITGTVTEAERSKALGKKGKLAFSIDYLYTQNGRVVKLRSQVEKNLKGSGAAVAAGAILLSPVALLFNGKNAKYEKGEVFTAYVDKDTKL